MKLSDSQVHALSLLASLLELLRAEIPVSHRLEVLAVVSEHIGEFAVVEAAQVGVYLVGLESLFKVDTHLGSDLGQHVGIHASVGCFLKEQVLGLGQAQVAVHVEGLLVEVSRVAVGWQLSRHFQKLLEDPGSLSEQQTRLLDAVSPKLHVAATAAETHCIVVQGREGS